MCRIGSRWLAWEDTRLPPLRFVFYIDNNRAFLDGADATSAVQLTTDVQQVKVDFLIPVAYSYRRFSWMITITHPPRCMRVFQGSFALGPRADRYRYEYNAAWPADSRTTTALDCICIYRFLLPGVHFRTVVLLTT